MELERPRLRGVLHGWAFPVSLVLGALLVASADGTREVVSATVFAVAVAVMLGVSALYHVPRWRPPVRRLMRRLDHAAIYLLIGGTYTPFGLLVLDGAWRVAVLAIVWTGAAAAIAIKVVWVDSPTWVAAALGVGLGWIGVVAFPEILRETGAGGTALLAAGGLLYTAGALVYAFQRPDPVPRVFGYHEVFHTLVIAAALCQYAAIAFFVLPA